MRGPSASGRTEGGTDTPKAGPAQGLPAQGLPAQGLGTNAQRRREGTRVVSEHEVLSGGSWHHSTVLCSPQGQKPVCLPPPCPLAAHRRAGRGLRRKRGRDSCPELLLGAHSALVLSSRGVELDGTSGEERRESPCLRMSLLYLGEYGRGWGPPRGLLFR